MKNSSRLLSALMLILLLQYQNKATAQIGNPYLIYRGAFNNAMFLTTKRAIERGMRSRDTKSSDHGVSKPSSTKTDLAFTSSLLYTIRWCYL